MAVCKVTCEEGRNSNGNLPCGKVGRCKMTLVPKYQIKRVQGNLRDDRDAMMTFNVVKWDGAGQVVLWR